MPEIATSSSPSLPQIGLPPYDFAHLLGSFPPSAATPTGYNTLVVPRRPRLWVTWLDPKAWPPKQRPGVAFPPLEQPVVLHARWLQREVMKYNS